MEKLPGDMRNLTLLEKIVFPNATFLSNTSLPSSWAEHHRSLKTISLSLNGNSMGTLPVQWSRLTDLEDIKLSNFVANGELSIISFSALFSAISSD